jgi:hypothetical protein
MNMMFSNPRTIRKPSNQQQMQSMNFIQRQTNFTRPAPPLSTNPTGPVAQSIASTEEPKKKMKWGPPTWFFLHTMAQKVKAEHFLTIRNGFLEQINAICRNLPCPDCSAHAAHYLDNSNLNRIQTKQQLIDFLFDFHNVVNARKGLPAFSREELLEKYSSAVTINIINYFLVHFLDKSKSIRMISNDFYRQRMIGILKQWLENNLQYFDA